MSNLKEYIRSHIVHLSEDIGQRNIFSYNSLLEAEDYITTTLKGYGYKVEFQEYDCQGKKCHNIIAQRLGRRPEEIIVIGAHYDSVLGFPGADDNASGVAVLLELASIFSQEIPKKTIRFVAFVNEEPPFYKSEEMGSFVYAKSCKEKNEKIQAMLCLESLGYFSDKKNSQTFPLGFMRWFYPDKGNFIAVVGNFASRSLVNKVKSAFGKNSGLPIEGLADFSFITGVDFSDHWSFWRRGYRACMLTDTAFYRNPYYHTQEDTYEKLDYENLAKIIKGLTFVIK